MKRYRVVAEWNAAYADPIDLNPKDEVWLSGKTDDWDGFLWIWAKNQAGEEGWIPDDILEQSDGRCFAKRRFSALELSCKPGETLIAHDETHGWAWCRSKDNREGWVPLRNLEEI